MDSLKIKFKFHALEYEVEGQQETAREEFRNFHDNILTPLLTKISIQSITLPNSSNTLLNGVNNSLNSNTDNQQNISKNDYPTLKDVKLRDLPKSEVDWLIVYCFYASEYGKKEFTRDEILQLYKETGRKTELRVKNLSQYFKYVLKGLYIKSIDDKNFIILSKGKDKAILILDGKSQEKETAKKQKKEASKLDASNETDENENHQSETRNKSNTSVLFVDLKFSISEMNSLRDFYASKPLKSQNDKVANVLQWHMDNQDIEGASLEEINYLMKIAENKIPSALGQVLINRKGPKLNLVEKSATGKFKLTSLGILHVSKQQHKD